jgi:hypothetical protein
MFSGCNIVFVIISLLIGNLIFNVVIVLAISKTLLTLIFMPLIFSILSSSLYTLQATKQIQTCVSMRFEGNLKITKNRNKLILNSCDFFADLRENIIFA